jgi:hypothetical protein
MRCDDCKHWNRAEGKYGTGLCTKAQPFWEASEWTEWDDDLLEPEAKQWKRGLKAEFADQKMFCQDGSDYKAILLTMPDFYCAHFEALELKD